jgi:hypothetical protein
MNCTTAKLVLNYLFHYKKTLLTSLNFTSLYFISSPLPWSPLVTVRTLLNWQLTFAVSITLLLKLSSTPSLSHKCQEAKWEGNGNYYCHHRRRRRRHCCCCCCFCWLPVDKNYLYLQLLRHLESTDKSRVEMSSHLAGRNSLV